MKNHNFAFRVIGLSLLAVVLAIAAFDQFRYSGIPEGVPSDYFERIEFLEDEDVVMYVYSDDLDFNGDYDFIRVSDPSDLVATVGRMRVLVIDMEKNVEDEFSSTETLRSIYEDLGFTILLVNYEKSGSVQYRALIQPEDLRSDMITFGHFPGGDGYTGSLSGEIPTQDMLEYAILHEVGLMIKENES